MTNRSKTEMLKASLKFEINILETVGRNTVQTLETYEESIVGNIEVRYIPYAKLLPDALVLVITKG
ncbi:hypothetical protein MTR_3g074750 [Medicago truncatula]|uniref:Uncharacterized protein n=1 Tax=Medicago truncatula TaxID=3880 RepID=A0A072UZU2_MEDTR|nr:hypothetical protein MTR_3g074750 [Medicago truncatula]